MNFSIIGQRIYDDNLENHLIEVLNEPDTVSCEALVAFITLNGLLRIGAGERGPLYNFITKPSTKFNWIVGIDNITTSDALATFKEFSDQSIPNYKVSAFSSKNIGIFHPKIFIFRKKNNTGTVIVGSNNLTQGGLFSNIEVSVKLENLESYELLVWE
ncbi:MAG: phospholipase D-like domain-containing protein, partial [Nanoarchaeota archaeon]